MDGPRRPGIDPTHWPAPADTRVDKDIWSGGKSGTMRGKRGRRLPRPSLTRSQSTASLRGTIRAKRASKRADISGKSVDITQMGAAEQKAHSKRIRRYGDRHFDTFLACRKRVDPDGRQPRWRADSPRREVLVLTPHYQEKVFNNPFLDLSEHVVPTYAAIDGALNDAGFEVAHNGEGVCYFHPDSGTTIGVTYDTKKDEFCVCCVGLGGSPTKGQDLLASKLAVTSLMGSKHLPHIDACNKFAEALSAIPGEGKPKITIVGHSHGGSIAQAIGLASGIETICFNSRQLSAKERNAIGGEDLDVEERAGVVTHYHTKGDPLSPDKGYKGTRRARRAKNVGTTYLVPRGNTYAKSKGQPGAHNDYGRWKYEERQ